MNKTTITSFESVRQGLISLGFTQDGDIFKKEHIQVQTMSINGHDLNHEYKTEQIVTYLGDGELFDDHKSETLAGFRLEAIIGEETHGGLDVYVRDFQEFTSLVRLS